LTPSALRTISILANALARLGHIAQCMQADVTPPEAAGFRAAERHRANSEYKNNAM